MNRQDAITLLLSRAVKQTRLGAPWGNCLEACYATLLGVPLSEVPDPRNRARSDKEAFALLPERIPALSAWVGSRGYARTCDTGSHVPGLDYLPWDAPLFWIASGPSERGFQHATIYANDQLVFDPHPSNAGLLSVKLWTVLAPVGPLWYRRR